MPVKERSYDQILASVAPVDRLVLCRCVRRWNSCADITVRAAVVPHWNLDGNADHRSRRRAQHLRCSDVDIRTRRRDEPADVYCDDTFTEPLVDDDGKRDERHNAV